MWTRTPGDRSDFRKPDLSPISLRRQEGEFTADAESAEGRGVASASARDHLIQEVTAGRFRGNQVHSFRRRSPRPAEPAPESAPAAGIWADSKCRGPRRQAVPATFTAGYPKGLTKQAFERHISRAAATRPPMPASAALCTAHVQNRRALRRFSWGVRPRNAAQDRQGPFASCRVNL